MRDVRVIEAGGELGLVEEQLHELGVVGVRRQDLLEHEQLLEALRSDGAREVAGEVAELPLIRGSWYED